MTEPLLALDRINTFYGAVQAHFDLSLEVGEGRIVSSARRQRQRQIDDDEGDPRPRRAALRHRHVQRRAHRRPATLSGRSGAGIGSVPEARRLFPLMTVRENLLMGAYARSDRKAVAADLDRMLSCSPASPNGINQRAGVLSGGEQQMLAMARALMGRPRLICMDEPTMGLSPLYVDQRARTDRRDQSRGDHGVHGRAERKSRLADRDEGYVLQTGRIVLHGSAAELRDDPRIREAYLGGAAAA